MPARSCGKCTMCCKLAAVPELAKPVNRWCDHCDVGRRCRIYDSRPPSCVRYSCLWESGELAEDLRPDRCKVLFERLPGKQVVIALREPSRQDAWRAAAVLRAIEPLLSSGDAVIVTGSPRRILLPPGRTLDDVETSVRETMIGLMGQDGNVAA